MDPEPRDETAPGAQRVPAGCMPPWEVAELPRAPRLSWSPRGLIGPGLMMAGAAIGGGEWLMGPAVTAQYGGIVMWLAMVSILFQVIYNLEIMRYTAYCGEPIVVGFFRLLPGPAAWTVLYLAVDFFGIWPYLSANAAVPLSAAVLGHLPGDLPTRYLSVEETAAQFDLPRDLVLEMKDHPERFKVGDRPGEKPLPAAIADRIAEENATRGRIAYAVFLLSFVPLAFGGKIYNSLEKIMVVKIVLVLGFLLFLGVCFVSPGTWLEVFAGFVFLGKGSDGSWGFRLLPDGFTASTVDWSLLAAFAAIAGQGGMTNSQTSTYVRDKGWGMGAQVGAMPSMVGGKGISLSHTGKVFRVSPESLERWKGWLRLFWRDQYMIWAIGCILGVAIPALVSLEFVRGARLQGDAIAAETARGIVNRTGLQAFWFLTLLCGFVVLVTSQVTQIDGIIRRWTDLLWTGSPLFKGWRGGSVKYIYYGLLAGYALWGLLVLRWLPSPLALTKFTGGIMNFALGFSSFHTLVVNHALLPRPLRPGLVASACLLCCGVFFMAISALGLHRSMADLGWL
ncbi:MAG: Nramp family divalent metal transporter [Planctomycetes bacterium]|nr:Nramp family divalent metal transporter [Planctomycetota bacterium]